MSALSAIRVTTAADDFPVSVSEAKQHLRITHNFDDDYIRDLLATATQRAETETRRKLVTQTVEIYLDCFPAKDETFYWNEAGRITGRYAARYASILLPGGYVSAVNEIEYIDPTGALQTLTGPSSQTPGTDYQEALQDTFEAFVFPAEDSDWPETDSGVVNAVRIEYVVGWPVDDVPATIKHAIRFMVADAYNSRDSAGKFSEQASALLEPQRIFRA